jgi:hypothetical protein
VAKLVHPQTLHELLEDAGIPIDGVCEDGRIDFADGATQEQRTQARAILATLRDKPKIQKREKKATRQAMKALGNADTNKLLLELLVEREIAEPGWASRRGVEIWPTP